MYFFLWAKNSNLQEKTNKHILHSLSEILKDLPLRLSYKNEEQDFAFTHGRSIKLLFNKSLLSNVKPDLCH